VSVAIFQLVFCKTQDLWTLLIAGSSYCIHKKACSWIEDQKDRGRKEERRERGKGILSNLNKLFDIVINVFQKARQVPGSYSCLGGEIHSYFDFLGYFHIQKISSTKE
jgi:hypothetical protein